MIIGNRISRRPILSVSILVINKLHSRSADGRATSLARETPLKVYSNLNLIAGE